jgi:cytoskeleton protein RodZ
VSVETAAPSPNAPDPVGQSTTVLPNPLEIMKTETPAPAAAQDGSTVPGTAAPANMASAAEATSPATAATSSPAVVAIALLLTFREKSWVEVRDANGTPIFLQTGAAGTTQTVNAAPPLDVVIGNAAGVGVTFRGQPVDFTQYTHANIAKFSLK